MEQNYLDSINKQFRYYKYLGEATFNQLSEADFFWQYHSECNSIAIIVNHLQSNMKSRWTDFLITDGEKTWRNRDQEFEDIIQSKQELLDQWQTGWDCLFEALSTINPDNFDTEIYIRNQGHTIMEAINRQLSHYSYHIGQIVFIGRMIKGEAWESLSIPKGKSTDFNKEKFAQKKRKEHFTKEYL